jgi:hypothetical protein
VNIIDLGIACCLAVLFAVDLIAAATAVFDVDPSTRGWGAFALVVDAFVMCAIYGAWVR